MRIPALHLFKNDKEKEPYVIETKAVADEWDVALNDLYRQANPDLPELKVGDEYVIRDVPYAYFKYKKRIWPIYDDDPGQQSCIYLDGTYYGAGAYTMYPWDVEYFCYEINEHYKKKGKSK